MSDVHRIFLRDEVAQRRFRRAIQQTVRPGDVVLDLGTGTGIHAIFACRAGAARVYALDREDVVQAATEIARYNGCGDRVICVQGRFPHVSLPEPVDVVVTNQGLSDTLRLLSSARTRILKPGGHTIPSAVRLFIVPVACPRGYDESVGFWEDRRYDVDFSPARRRAVDQVHDYTFRPAHFLATPAGLAPIELSAALPAVFRWSARFALSRSGTLHGLGGWFDYQLSRGVTLSTRPPMAVASPPWQNLFFPFREPARVRRGDRLDVDLRLSVQPSLNVWVWKAAAMRRRGRRWMTIGRFSQSNVYGLPLSKEKLEKLSPSAVPKLTGWGEARLAALRLCDGRRSLSEIGRALQERYPHLFASIVEADAFVAELVTRDAS